MIRSSSENEAQGNDLPVRKIGPYRLESRLGSGGMGAVYRAFDERLERPVALKQILPDAAEDPRARARFRREARSAARLDHPGIVKVHDIVEAEDSEWIVMEFVEGQRLKDLIATGPLPIEQVLNLGIALAEALAAAHAEDIVHRDLKASNVLVTSTGSGSADRAKILDFGLAKRVPRPGATTGSISEVGQLMGTPHAMSPEQALGREVDLRSDLFSLGTLFYEMLTGRSPFRAENNMETLTRICVHQPTPVREKVPEVPSPLSDLVERLHEKNAAHRPASASDVAALLRRIAAGEELPQSLDPALVEDETISSHAGAIAEKEPVETPMGMSPWGEHGGESLSPWGEHGGESLSRVPRNPFFHRQAIPDPRHFYGRADMVRSLLDMVGSGQSCAVVGERRIGKSSLLAHLTHPEIQAAHGLEPQKLLAPVLDFLALHTVSPQELWTEILEALEMVASDAETRADLKKALERDEVSFAVLRRTLRRLKRRGLRVVLLCDEFELAVQNPKLDQGFFGALRSLAGNEGVAFVTATRLNLLELEQYKSEELRQKVLGSPFFNIFAEFQLGPFESHEVAELLATSLESTAMRFDRDDVDWLGKMAGRHPYFLQLAAYHLYEAHDRYSRSSDTGTRATGDSYTEASKELRREAAKIFRNQWHHSGEDERRILGILAAAAAAGTEARSTADPRIVGRLERRALLRRVLPPKAAHRDGDLRCFRLFSEIFTEWILAEVTVSLGETAEDVQVRRIPAAAPPGPVERYSILEEIGRGGAGTVYKAWDDRLHRVVAIKVLDAELRAAPQHLDRLLAEARTCAGLNHPNIVVVYDIDDENGQLVQEFLAGGSLRDLLESVPVLAMPDLMQLARHLASALGAAHEAGVIHRDLKPENVLLAARPPIHSVGVESETQTSLLPLVKLGDFGTALRLDDLDSASERRSIAGTLAYMAPEQMLGEGVGPAADFFALGMMLYEARHGGRPVPARAEQLARRAAEAVGPDAVFDRTVARCLATDPRDRYRSAEELMAALAGE